MTKHNQETIKGRWGDEYVVICDCKHCSTGFLMGLPQDSKLLNINLFRCLMCGRLHVKRGNGYVLLGDY